MSTETRAPNALLWIILLAVLIEPLALALILNREDPDATPPQPDRALAEAVAALSRQIERLEKSPPPFAPDAARSPAAAPEPVAPAAPGLSRPFPKPKPGVPVVTAAAKRYPRKQANIDVWVNHERERNARGEADNPMLFFHRTTSEILAEFGIPDLAIESEAGVRWEYKGSDGSGGGSFLIDFHAGRVYRIWFS
jgi:hypothetical protein